MIVSLHFGTCDYCGKWIGRDDQSHLTVKQDNPTDIGPLLQVVACSPEHLIAYLALDQIEREQRITTMYKDMYEAAGKSVKATVDNWKLAKMREQYANEDHSAEPA